MIRELPGYQVKDGRRCIYLSTCGENSEEISEDMAEFWGYVSANLKESVKASKNSFVKQLQEAVKQIKKEQRNGESVYDIPGDDAGRI